MCRMQPAAGAPSTVSPSQRNKRMEFIKGVDVSMTEEVEQHGAAYFLHGEQKDLFELLQTCGVNLVRLRLWNSPYSEAGEAYGGGTNDYETTVRLAKRVKQHGMKFMLDFHYSDFWTDPAKQIKPKAWAELTGKALEMAVYQYTRDTLAALEQEEILPEYVQIGNEITKGLLWPDGHVDNTAQMARLLGAGIRAVKEQSPDIKIILHLDFGTDNELYRNWFSKIEPYGLEYDIIGMTYYPFWNGAMEDLIANMNDISRRFNKEVLVAETSIGYTADSLGCHGMIFSEELEEKTPYPATKEGQEQFLRELYTAVRSVEQHRGIGIVYWEPAWLPFPACAWANQLGCQYMNDKAETGNSWANQALFDKDGNANPALLALSEL